VANLPPVSTTQAELVAKFAASVADTSANLPLVSFAPVSLTPVVVHLDLQREFSKKFEMTLMLFSGARGKVIHEKKSEAKNLTTLSLSAFIALSHSCQLSAGFSAKSAAFEQDQ
jgi:hypothetical protein